MPAVVILQPLILLAAAVASLLGLGASSQGATWHVTPGGTGTKCSRSAPCGSFNAAYQAARRGDTVRVAAGAYGEQMIEPRLLLGYDSQSPSGEEITFEGPGASVDGMTLSSVRGAPVEHIAFEDLEFTGWTAIHSAGDVHFTRTTHREQLHANWVRYLSYRNIEVGPFVDDTGDGLQFNQIDGRAGQHLLIAGSRIHDVHPNSGAAHPDAIQFYGPYHDTTLRGNRLWNNDNINLRGDPAMQRYVVENNFFGRARDPVVPRYYTAQIQGNGAVIRYNSFAGALQPSGAGEHSGQVWEGNVMTWTTCDVTGSNSTVRHNVWVRGTTCGTSRTSVRDPRFVDAEAGDLHLRPGSPALGKGNPGSYPVADIDGQSRPTGSRPDAGADELEESGSRRELGRRDALAMRGLHLARTQRGLAVRLRLSAPARVSGRVERRRENGYRRVRRLRSRSLPAGRTQLRLGRLRQGRYRVRLVAVNRRGDRERAALRFRVPPR